MAKCKLCGKSGLFLSLDKDGYCKECAELRAMKQKEKEEKERIAQQRAQKAQDLILSLPRFEIVPSEEKKKRNKDYPEPKFSNITPKGKFYDFVVIDTETTGLAPSRDRIVELAAIKFKDGIPAEVFHTFINPEKEIPASASRINGITNKDVENAPVIGKVIQAFDDFVGDSTVVAHNLDFDLKFVYYSGSDLATKKNRFIDTVAQAQKQLKTPKRKYDKEYGDYEIDYDSDYDVEDYKLDTLCQHFDIKNPKQHSALYDALATGKLFLRLVFEKQGTMPNEIFNSLKE